VLLSGRYCLPVSIRELGFVILTIAIETAKPTVTLLATPDTLTLRNPLAAVWANTLVPQFKEITPLLVRQRRLGAPARSLTPFLFPQGS
jgi:hypothetical protein